MLHAPMPSASARVQAPSAFAHFASQHWQCVTVSSPSSLDSVCLLLSSPGPSPAQGTGHPRKICVGWRWLPAFSRTRPYSSRQVPDLGQVVGNPRPVLRMRAIEEGENGNMEIATRRRLPCFPRSLAHVSRDGAAPPSSCRTVILAVSVSAFIAKCSASSRASPRPLDNGPQLLCGVIFHLETTSPRPRCSGRG